MAWLYFLCRVNAAIEVDFQNPDTDDGPQCGLPSLNQPEIAVCISVFGVIHVPRRIHRKLMPADHNQFEQSRTSVCQTDSVTACDGVDGSRHNFTFARPWTIWKTLSDRASVLMVCASPFLKPHTKSRADGFSHQRSGPQWNERQKMTDTFQQVSGNLDYDGNR